MAREAIALRRLIEEHNAGLVVDCVARGQSGESHARACAYYKGTPRGMCPDCPRRGNAIPLP